MKTTPPLRHLLRFFFLCLFCCASLSVLAQGDNDSDRDPDSPPPKKSPASAPAATAAVFSTSGSLEVIFLEDVNDVEVEVLNEEGVTISVNVGTVDANSRLQVDTHRWKRGSYMVRVSVKGKPMSMSTVQLQ